MKTWLPEDVKKLREKLGLYQADFGAILGVTGNYIHLLEKGVKKPSKTLCLLLDCVKEKTKKKGGEKRGKGNL